MRLIQIFYRQEKKGFLTFSELTNLPRELIVGTIFIYHNHILISSTVCLLWMKSRAKYRVVEDDGEEIKEESYQTIKTSSFVSFLRA